MKTIFLIILTLVFLSPTLFGQKNENPVNTKPGEQITVNKEYDDKGNLISFDSTYTFEWHGDTMMVFPNGGNSFFHFDEFPDRESFFNGVFSDSLHHFSPFGDDWDQNFFGDFSFHPDSLSRFFGNDSTFEFPFQFEEFNFPDMSEFFKHFDEFNNQGQPSFKDDEQQKEWEGIMKKQQKEMEEFQKKWDSKNKGKPKADIKLQKI